MAAWFSVSGAANFGSVEQGSTPAPVAVHVVNSGDEWGESNLIAADPFSADAPLGLASMGEGDIYVSLNPWQLGEQLQALSWSSVQGDSVSCSATVVPPDDASSQSSISDVSSASSISDVSSVSTSSQSSPSSESSTSSSSSQSSSPSSSASSSSQSSSSSESSSASSASSSSTAGGPPEMGDPNRASEARRVAVAATGIGATALVAGETDSCVAVVAAVLTSSGTSVVTIQDDTGALLTLNMVAGVPVLLPPSLSAWAKGRSAEGLSINVAAGVTVRGAVVYRMIPSWMEF